MTTEKNNSKIFSVGYSQLDQGEDYFLNMINDYRDHIKEVYFAWPGTASGRNSMGSVHGRKNWNSQYQLEDELINLKKMGIKLNLLFNANCYGKYAVSEYLANEVTSIIEHLNDVVGGVDSISTTSITIARTVKNLNPEIDIRASVNMKIDSPPAMEMVQGLFDSFCICRDHQRDPEHLKRLRNWCNDNGKKVSMLVNSGCMFSCPGQIFHDNMVAHDAEIDEVKNIPDWSPFVCWNNLSKPEMRYTVLHSTWIRPEDLHQYLPYTDTVKLATRLHTHPRMVLDAYTSGSFRGNLLDLFEPSFSSIFAPYFIDNKAFPDDWFKVTSSCKHCCETCSYCKNTAEKVFKKFE